MNIALLKQQSSILFGESRNFLSHAGKLAPGRPSRRNMRGLHHILFRTAAPRRTILPRRTIDREFMALKSRNPPQQIATRSRSALEAMCVAVVRRVSGLESVSHVAIVEIEAPDGKPNWEVGTIAIVPPLAEADRRRIEAALASWRQRFRLS